MERVERETFGLFCPESADVFVGGEALEGLQPFGEVVGADEVGEMASELHVRLVVEAFDGRLFDGAVHTLDLAIGPRMPGLGEAVVDTVLGASEFEGVSAEDLTPLEHGVDLGRSPAIAARIGEVRAVVGQDGVDFVGNGFEKGSEEVRGDAPRRLLMQLGEGELRGSVDGHEEIELAFLGADFGNVDVEVADGIGLELALPGLGVFHLREPGDVVALQTTMQ